VNGLGGRAPACAGARLALVGRTLALPRRRHGRMLRLRLRLTAVARRQRLWLTALTRRPRLHPAPLE